METSEKNSFSLYELNEHLRRVIAFNMREALWINCEIADVNSKRGNVYLSLVERDSEEIIAQSDAAIWRKDLASILKKIGDSLWSILQVGRQILVRVDVEYHEYYGMKLVVRDIDPSLTIGQLELKRMQILKQLEEDKFTELNATVDVPVVFQRLAVLSSGTAAGYQDFIMQLERNPHRYKFHCELFEVAVQGVRVAADVVAQLQEIDKRKHEFDAVIIVRGGGARIDLMGFDDYNLCVAVATCELPVLSGIGHDIDETLTDLVAYKSLKTPTAVADFLIHKALLFESELAQIQKDIIRLVQQKIVGEKQQLELYRQKIETSVKLRINKEYQYLEQIQSKIELLNPEAILKRGFSVLTDESGERIQSVQQVENGKVYTLQLADGSIKVEIK